MEYNYRVYQKQSTELIDKDQNGKMNRNQIVSHCNETKPKRREQNEKKQKKRVRMLK